MSNDSDGRTDPRLQGIGFDQFVLDTADGLFAEALGRDVADVLRHSFLTREPQLADPGVDRSLVLQRVLAESFGDFHSIIMDIIVEQVCKSLGVPQAQSRSGESLNALSDARKAYSSGESRSSGAA